MINCVYHSSLHSAVRKLHCHMRKDYLCLYTAAQSVRSCLINVFIYFKQASTGIANLLLRALIDEGLTEQQASDRIYLFDVHGLLVQVRYSVILSSTDSE